MGRGIQGKYNFRPPPEKVWPPVEGPSVTDWDTNSIRAKVIPEPKPRVPGEDIRDLMKKLDYMERQGVDTWPPVEGQSGTPIKENMPKPYGPQKRED